MVLAALVLTLLAADSDLENRLARAERRCTHAASECPARDRLAKLVAADNEAIKAKQQPAATPTPQDLAQKKSDADYQALLNSAEDAEQVRADALKKKCGKDYMRVRVGMNFNRVQKCAGDFESVEENTQFQVWEASGGRVWVQHGKIIRVIFSQ